MTSNENSKNREPGPEGFETGRAKGKGASNKGPREARRVSQRKELAVVTLGMVASVAGLGGLLAAPPSLLAAQEEIAPVSVEAPANTDVAQEDTSPALQEAAPAPGETLENAAPGVMPEDRGVPAPEGDDGVPASPAQEPPVQEGPADHAPAPSVAPSWSSFAPPQTPATRTRGS